MRNLLFLSILAILISSCTVVRQGEVGVKRKFGKLNENISDAGLVGFNPLTTRVIKVPIQTVNQEVRLNLPSKEGLTIESEISILYNIKKNKDFSFPSHRFNKKNLLRNIPSLYYNETINQSIKHEKVIFQL